MKQNFFLPSWNARPQKKVAYTNARLYDPESNLDVKGGLLTIGDTIAD
ncbi:MAG: dihydroorotase, partial [Alphaproteobacteria bacterium]|nr:dihydroorotase [Alphaproteobacteria bacterium]